MRAHDPLRGAWSRRDLLKALGAGALVSPFLPRSAAASDGGPHPQAMLLFYHPNGLESGWAPTGNRTAFVLSPVMAPLARHQQRIAVVDGVKSGMSNTILAHSQGMVSMWTGCQLVGDVGFSPYPSLDQVVARRIGGAAPFRSLELGVQCLVEGVQAHSVMAYGEGGLPLPADDDPDSVFARVFGVGTGDPERAAVVRAERRSVLDLVYGRLQRVQQVYGAEDAVRIEAHLEAVRSVERRLDQLADFQCGVQESEHGLTRAELLTDSRVFGDIASLQTDLAVAALSCGVTRVVSLQLSFSTSPTELPGLGLPGVHGVLHAGTADEKAAVNTWFMGRLAMVLDALEAAPGMAGGSLLDTTQVVAGTEMSVGGHGNAPIPVILAGGNAFPGGRWHHFPDPPRHTRLLTTVLRGMGIEDEDIAGDFPDETDPLPELFR